LEDNPFLQEHSTFLKFIFREENSLFFHQKQKDLSDIFNFPNTFSGKFWNFSGNFSGISEFFREIFGKSATK